MDTRKAHALIGWIQSGRSRVTVVCVGERRDAGTQRRGKYNGRDIQIQGLWAEITVAGLLPFAQFPNTNPIHFYSNPQTFSNTNPKAYFSIQISINFQSNFNSILNWILKNFKILMILFVNFVYTRHSTSPKLEA